MRYWTIYFLAAAAMISIPSHGQAETLAEALAMAYATNPELAAQRANLRATDEQMAIAKSGYRPQAGANIEVNRVTTDPSGAGSFGSTNQSYSTSVAQPLFRGYRTTNSVKSAQATIFAGRELLRSTEHGIMLDAVTVFMDVIRDSAVLKLNENQVAVLRRQLQATRDRFRVGELTRTDVAQSEARVARADSQRIAAQGQLDVSRDGYQRVIGQEPGTLVEPVLPALPVTLDEAISIAMAESPRLLATKYVEEASKYDVETAKGAVLPSADAVAALSRSDRSNLGNQILGSSTQNSASIGAQVSIPLYQSGAEYARVRQAKQRASQRRIEISVAERQVSEQTRNTWAFYRTAKANIDAQNAAVRANEVAAEGVRQEQSVGSRTILDVLDAEQELLNARVQLVLAQRDAAVAAYGLLASIGRLDAKSMGLTVDAYDPARHYENVKDKWFGWDTTD
jgi:TolC family type I secretion outer membrane protein